MGRTGLTLRSDGGPDNAVPVMLLDKRGTTVQPLAVGRVNTAASTTGRIEAMNLECPLAGEGQVTCAAMARLASVLDPYSSASVRGNHRANTLRVAGRCRLTVPPACQSWP